jgi:hypothetical protein
MVEDKDSRQRLVSLNLNLNLDTLLQLATSCFKSNVSASFVSSNIGGNFWSAVVEVNENDGFFKPPRPSLTMPVSMYSCGVLRFLNRKRDLISWAEAPLEAVVVIAPRFKE